MNSLIRFVFIFVRQIIFGNLKGFLIIVKIFYVGCFSDTSSEKVGGGGVVIRGRT